MVWYFHTWRVRIVLAVPTQEGRAFPMAKYSRAEIDALSQRLEVKASVLDAQTGRDLMAAALLLRLMVQLAEVKEIETSSGERQRWPC